MLIVPIGNVLLQGADVEVPDRAFQVMENIAWALPGIIGQMLNKHLEMEIRDFWGATIINDDAMPSAKKHR